MFTAFTVLISLLKVVSSVFPNGTVLSVFPNGTDAQLNFFACNSDDPITVASIEFYARNGASMYPIDLTNLAVIKLESYNNGDLVEKDNVDVDIYTYVKYGNQWTWKNVIPEGFRFLLRNLNGCAIAHNCPLTKGELQLALALDLSKYSFLFRFIDKNAAHQFVIKMHDAKNDEQICCQTVQLRIV